MRGLDLYDFFIILFVIILIIVVGSYPPTPSEKYSYSPPNLITIPITSNIRINPNFNVSSDTLLTTKDIQF